jgi:vacuolar protein-sorting-associated protein 4
MGSDLYKMAMQKAIQAVDADNQNRLPEAIRLYQEASGMLLDMARITPNLKLKAFCEQRGLEYKSRAEELQGKAKGRGKATRKGSGKKTSRGSAKSSGSQPGEDGGDDADNMDDEERALLEQIEGTIVTERPTTTWAQVAGMETAKQALREAVVLPIRNPRIFSGARTPWRGILLYGPPGCGKTLLAKAAANECDVQFFLADSASLMSKWLGESEKLIKTLFRYANLKAPSLIFFDEIDSMATTRSSTDSGGGNRVKTQLLQELQGLKTDVTKIVLALGATNRPWDIDSAILRRFEQRIYIGTPSAEGREKIFMYGVRGVRLQDVDFTWLAEHTDGYSGSDITTICREVVMLPLRELDSSGEFHEELSEKT